MDTVHINTTQNINIQYKMAGVFQRILAYLLDSIFMGAFSLIMILIVFNSGDDTLQIFVIAVFILDYLYFLICETLMNGQTFGKRILNIRVVKLDGSKPTLSAYILRWIMLPIDVFITSGGIAVVLIAFTKNGQRIGDILAGTTVIKTNVQNSTLAINRQVIKQVDETYTPVYPDAVKLNDRDIRLIHRSIEAFRLNSQRRPVEALKEKLEEKIQVKSDLPPIKFLHTLVKDYNYYAARAGQQQQVRITEND